MDSQPAVRQCFFMRLATMFVNYAHSIKITQFGVLSVPISVIFTRAVHKPAQKLGFSSLSKKCLKSHFVSKRGKFLKMFSVVVHEVTSRLEMGKGLREKTLRLKD